MKLAVRFLNDERGISLLEQLAAVLIMAIAGLALMSAISTESQAARTVDLQSTARNAAVAQMEYTKAQTYLPPPATYPTVTPPSGWGVTATASAIAGRDTNVEKVTVTVSLSGVTYLTLEGYKGSH